MPGFRLAVDYGTADTVAVLATPDGETRPLRFEDSEFLPSAVYLAPDGSLLTGRDAVRAGLQDPAGLEPHPRRRVGEGRVRLRRIAYPVEDLIAATLRTVWAKAVESAGTRPDTMVMTYPAEWDEKRRTVLRSAVRKAQEVARTYYVTEAVAAATGFETAGDRVPVGLHAVLCDAGAEGFAVSVLRRDDKGFALVSGAREDVGGLAFDRVVLDLVKPRPPRGELLARFWREVTSPERGAWHRARPELWEKARRARERLSSRTAVQLSFDGMETRVGREDFDREAAGLYERAAVTVTRTVAEAAVEWGRVWRLFLTGGLAEDPCLARVIAQECGITPTVAGKPRRTVAEGALGQVPPVAPLTVLSPRVAGLVEQAAETARSIVRRSSRILAGHDLVEGLVLLDPSRATGYAYSLRDDSDKKETLTHLVESLAETGVEEAARFALTFPADRGELSATVLLAGTSALAGTQPGRAEHVARLLPEEFPEYRAAALLEVAGAGAIGAHRAARLVAEAEAILRRFPDRADDLGNLGRTVRALAWFDPHRAGRRIGEAPRVSARDLAKLAEALIPVDPALAERVAHLIPAESADLKAGLVGGFAAGDPARAVSLARSLAEPQRERALVDAVAAIAAHDPDRAETVAATITDRQRHADALGRIAAALAATDPDRAERLVRTLPGGFLLTDELGVLAEALVPVDLGRALRLVGDIPVGSFNRFNAFGRLIPAVAPVDPDLAESLLAQLGPLSAGARSTALMKIAGVVAPTDPARAERLVGRAEEIPAALRGGDQSTSVARCIAEGLPEVAAALAPTDPARAERLAGRIPDDHPREKVAALVAVALAVHRRATS
ncbi:Hsp70 family protein [Phytomonospora sp. NPDC050363]|uniref:Hsp70 family protein n=1 Tax=Phytomonospora sp. NPDC050363 TaxID=3155642 RepID=UPI0033DE316B